MQLSKILSVWTFYCFVLASGEMRWCKVSDAGSSPAEDGWIYYDDSTSSCVSCSADSVTLISNELVDGFECCNGMLLGSGKCQADLKESGENCSNTKKCDKKKQCTGGRDEIGCGSCNMTGLFACQDTHLFEDETSTVCLFSNKICDSQKDCRLGLDETGCKWHQGWCEGFLCGKPHERCIPQSQVCDGTKQCIDGSDEINCQFCDLQFRCLVVERNSPVRVTSRRQTRTGECIGTFRVCDGKRDCSNGLDETNCYRWREWSPWSRCEQETKCNRTRTRLCVSGQSSLEVDASFCLNVEDYHATDDQIKPDVQHELILFGSTSALVTSSTPASAVTMKENWNTGTKAVEHSATTTKDYNPTVDSNSSWKNMGEKETNSSHNSVTPAHHNDPNNEYKSVPSTPRNGGNIATTEYVKPKQASPTALALIIAAAIIAAIIIVILLCCLIFGFTDRRRRTGKWTPRKFRSDREIRVPDMYNDVTVGDTPPKKKNLPRTQKESNEPLAMSSFYGVTMMSAIDSGIDDANSTSSSEVDNDANMVNSPFAGRKSLNHGNDASFPPLPPNIKT